MSKTVWTALALLVLGNVFSALYDVSIKWLPDDASATMFVFFRQLSAVVILLPMWCAAGRPGSNHWKLHTARSWTATIGGLALVYGLMTLPLATVSSLFYSAPLMIVLLGFALLKERISSAQVAALVLGFVGILLILRPSEMNLAGLVVLVSAFIFAANQLALRLVPKEEPASVTLLSYNLFSLPLLLAIIAWQGFSGFSWTLVAIAFLSNAALLFYHWLCVLAYRTANASDIAVAEYTGLLFCVLFGIIWFDEWMDSIGVLGAALIVLPSMLLPYLQNVWIKRQQPTLQG